ncbi:MAG: sigma 54-interacting transcriptional regulator [Myxococcales bacterium]|nr:sigma 54-interacting transcriptional regulator [Myxococcales bacterium]
MTHRIIDRRYRYLRVLGVGGMGEVLAVEDMLSGEQVALKRLTNLDLARQLREEFRLLTQLEHPNLPTVYRLGQDAETGTPYFTMELCDGITWEQFSAPSSTTDFSSHKLDLFVQVVRAVLHIHSQGFVHGDLGSANVIVTTRAGNLVAKVLDFGLAVAAHQRTVGPGALPFSAPERLRGEQASVASDLFSLGILGWLLFFGAHPYHRYPQIMPDPTANPTVGSSAHLALLPILRSMIAIDVASRPHSAEAVLDHLSQIIEVTLPKYTLPVVQARVGHVRWVGAEDTIRTLESLSEQLEVQRRGGVLHIEAPQGFGKTRCLRDLAASLSVRGIDVLVASGSSSGTSVPVVDQLLEQRLGPATAEKPAELAHLSDVQVQAIGTRFPNWKIDYDTSRGQENPLVARKHDVDALARALLALSISRPTAILVDDIDTSDADSWEVLCALARAITTESHVGENILLITSGIEIQSAIPGNRCTLAAWDQGEICAYLEGLFRGKRTSTGVASLVWRITGGIPTLVEETTLSMFANGQLVVNNEIALSGLDTDLPVVQRSIDDIFIERIRRLDEGSVNVLQIMSVALGLLTSDILSKVAGIAVGDLLATLTRLTAAGLIRRFELPSRVGYAITEPVRRCLPVAARYSGSLTQLHWRLATAFADIPMPEAATAAVIHQLLASNGANTNAIHSAIEIANDSRRNPTEVLRLLQNISIECVSDPELRAKVHLLRGEALTALSHFDPAATELEHLGALAVTDVQRSRAALALGLLAFRRGRYADAENLFQQAVVLGESAAEAATAQANVVAWFAKSQLFQGRYADARETAQFGLTLLVNTDATDADEALGRLLHVLGLAAFYAADLDAALEFFTKAQRLFENLGQPVDAAEMRNCRGLVHHRKDQYVDALDAYRGALATFEQAGDRSREWTLLMNMGVVFQEQGEYAAAVEHYRRGLSLANILGDRAGILKISNNLGNLMLHLGQLKEARQFVDRSLTYCMEDKNRYIGAYNRALLGEIARIGEDYEECDRCLEASRAEFADMGCPNEAAEVELELARSALEQGKFEDVLRLAAGALDVAREHKLLDLHAYSLQCMAERERRMPGGNLEDAQTMIEEALDIAQQLDSSEVAWKIHWTTALIARDRGDIERACAQGRKASTKLSGMIRKLPLDLQGPFRSVRPRRDALAELAWVDALAPGTVGHNTDAGTFGPTVSKLLEINKRLNSEHELDRLLEFIMDAAIVLTGAERGFLLLEDDDGAGLSIRVARNIDQENIRNRRFKISMTIAERVFDEDEPIVTIDAMEDERYKEFLSIHSLRLRSILCVPLRRSGRPVGVLYVDNRFQVSAFGEADIGFMEAFAEQAAIAIGNARLFQENSRARLELQQSKKEIEELNQQLQDRLQRTSQELLETQTRVQHQQRQLENRHRYENIIGASNRLREVLYVIDRVRDSDIPVLISGESGTGKELVARAIHYNGTRKDQEFVAVNCASIPATLFESELFGHVRGAFTGANTDKRGFFEFAHRGTLFLDEIGELPIDMQAKLLRVLQSGEIQKVGSPKPTKVDVRIVAATNRDLKEEVVHKRFREDLYYRLNVVGLVLPPLRERKEDIPVLVQHFIAANLETKLSKVTKISPEAISLLSRYNWPGNVRQLDTVVKNASIFAESDTLMPADFAHLSELMTPDSESAPTTGGEILSRSVNKGPVPTLADVEREMIIRTLENVSGNKKKAAEVLGIDRRTLYNKLESYGIQIERRARVVPSRGTTP